MNYLDEAKKVSLEAGYVGVSILQRKMRIGYPRAARLVGDLIADGFCDNEYISNTPHRAIKEAAQLRLQLTGLYCQLCGEPLLEHFVTENGGHCQPPRN